MMGGGAAKHKLIFLLGLWAFCMGTPLLHAQGKSRHALWESQLERFVSRDGKVNYAAWQKDREPLDAYIEQLAVAPPQPLWPKNDLLAYWINAYNALTVQLILDHYPVKSIKDIPSRWSIPVFTTRTPSPTNNKDSDANGHKDEDGLEKTYSLGDIEHKILRKQGEKRIHFAINCASVSCPNLYRSAFTGSKLEYQLETVTRQFFHDQSKNQFEAETIKISKILLWFIMDFGLKKEKLRFLSRYSPIPLDANVRIRYQPYDWSLNE